MNKEEFVEKIKDIKVNVPDEEFFLEYNKIIYDILNDKENLVKYLEGLLTGNKTTDMFIVTGVQNLLERIKSGKYE